MKSLKIILIAAIMMVPIFALAQHQHQSVKEMMKDKPMQDSIMTMICSNPMMMDEMTMHIMKNKEAMHSMMQQKGMMKEMMDMTSKDSTISRSMMNMMMQHPEMMKMMQNRMQQKGMMSGNGMMKK
jgi:phage pi2 protein 07